jgi:anthranilate phosphoribosyltransferase
VTAQVMGVADEELTERIAQTLVLLGAERAMVVHGQGMDEISTLGKTKIYRLMEGKITQGELDPASLGISRTNIDELTAGDATTNAAIISNILEDRDRGPRRDIVVLNAAAAIIVADIAEDFQSGMALAEEAIGSGRAQGCLDKLIKVSNS